MARSSLHPLRIFATGLLAALPLAATIAIFWWAADLLLRWLGPDSMVGGFFISLGLGVGSSEVLGYVIGVGLVALLIFLLGALVEAGLERGLARLVDAILGRIPVVRSVYEFAQKMVSMFGHRDAEGMQSMSAVWCHFGGSADDGHPRAAVLALLSTPEPVLIGGQPYLGVILPTAPVPVGGGLLFLPQAWVTPAHVGIDALTSIYVSMGMTASQHLTPKPKPNPNPKPASGPPAV